MLIRRNALEPMNYHRLTEDEREETSRMLAQGCSCGEIARFLGRSVSTISREIAAGGCNRYTYRAATAHRRARRKARKRKLGKRKIVLLPRLRGYVHSKLRLRWSPDEIADRVIPGHWEGDLLVGKNRQSFLGSLVERTTRTTILIPLKNKRAEEARKAFAKEAKKIPSHMRLSMTYDQGNEMAEHQLFTKETKMRVYFAHPASPWERGTNENTNGNIRQFFPKGTDFSKISRREVKRVQHLLNGRPRKVLGYATPYEIFNKLLR